MQHRGCGATCIALAVLAVAYLGVSVLVTNSYYQLILTLVPIWAVFGVSWNILSGYGGQLSFGHASFFGIGAYTVTLALVYWNMTPWLGIPLGVVLGAHRGHRHRHCRPSGCAGITSRCRCWPIRWPSSISCNISASRKSRCRCIGSTRRRSSSSPIRATTRLSRWDCWSRPDRLHAGGELAFRPRAAGDPAERTGSRGGGHRCTALEDARADRLRLIAAAAGGLYACVLLVVTPDSVFGMLVSAQPVVVTLFGGVASIWGPVIGAAILVPLAKLLNAELGNIMPGIQGVVYGAAIIAHHSGRARWPVLDDPRPLFRRTAADPRRRSPQRRRARSCSHGTAGRHCC